jgi:starch phosphorylase
MKFALNGALTIGTLDGANVEMLEEVGAENIFIFGHKTAEVRALQAAGYNPKDRYSRDSRIRRVVDSLVAGTFSKGENGIFEPIFHTLINQGDHYLHIADFGSYVEAQDQVSRAFTNTSEWSAKAILNVARMGKFSSDRSIQEYARDIWGIHALPPA